jgi:hypothetical protein
MPKFVFQNHFFGLFKNFLNIFRHGLIECLNLEKDYPQMLLSILGYILDFLNSIEEAHLFFFHFSTFLSK